MSEMGTSIDTLRQSEEDEDKLIRNIKEDYTEQIVQPQPILNNDPIISEIQHQRREEIEEILPPQESLLSKIYYTVKDTVIFLIIFITFNYEPIALVVDSWMERINVPYIGLVIRAIIASIVFFFIKKFI
uniref:Uncharacterized protein n=1 Tax=viral metagenome TaxID=1070528 RepID=A0A6C0J8U8_9ZZZZ